MRDLYEKYYTVKGLEDTISNLSKANDSVAASLNKASELLVKQSTKIAKLEVENKELKIEIQNLHQFIKNI